MLCLRDIYEYITLLILKVSFVVDDVQRRSYNLINIEQFS